jgi:hypothetical protein
MWSRCDASYSYGSHHFGTNVPSNRFVTTERTHSPYSCCAIETSFTSNGFESCGRNQFRYSRIRSAEYDGGEMGTSLEELITRSNLEMERAAILQATMSEVIVAVARSRKELQSVMVERRMLVDAIHVRWSTPIVPLDAKPIMSWTVPAKSGGVTSCKQR